MPLAGLVDDVPEIPEKWPTGPTLFRRDPADLDHLWSLAEFDARLPARGRGLLPLRRGAIVGREQKMRAPAE